MSEETEPKELHAWFVSFLMFDDVGINGGGNTVIWLNLTEITAMAIIRRIEKQLAEKYGMDTVQLMSFQYLPNEPKIEPKRPSVIQLVR